MSNFLRLSILVTGVLLIMGCLITDCLGPAPSPTPTPNTTSQAVFASVLTLNVQAQPNIYNAVGQQITFTYQISYTGSSPLPGPASIATDKLGTIPCPNLNTVGNLDANLDNGEVITCSNVPPYAITQADISNLSMTHTATASAGGLTSNPVQTTIQVGLPTATPGPGVSSSITPGSMVMHIVTPGDWLLQISRCYGANLSAIVRANPQIRNPNLIYFPSTVAVPNAGSDGKIYGLPCFIWYTTVSGDTWQTIAQKHNADREVLRAANPGVTMAVGIKIKVPVNSAGGSPITPIPTTPPAPTTPPPTVVQPIRINPQPGVPLQQPGTINTPGRIQYVFNAATGQNLNVRLTATTNDIQLAIYGPGNAVLKPLDLNPSWNGSLTTNGDHIIELVSSVGVQNKSFTLEVTLTAPTPVSPVVRAADINPGSGDSNPAYLARFNMLLYFQANANDGVGAELWKYDAGLRAVSRVSDINPGPTGSEPAFLTPYKEMLYFRANGNDGGGLELWRFNGSATGRVTDLNPGTADSNPMYLTVFNDNLYFSADGNDGAGVELWRYDGTISTRAADINPGSGSSNPAYLAVYNNALYFSATSNDGAGTELWKFDGSTATRVADINVGIGNSNPSFLAEYNSLLYFSANGNDGAGTELWKFDGTTASRAADINPGPADSAPTYLTSHNNILYFSAIGDSTGFELWRFDGTAASRVADINPAGNSNPSYLEVYNNQLYFQANANDGAGIELWVYTGP